MENTLSNSERGSILEADLIELKENVIISLKHFVEKNGGEIFFDDAGINFENKGEGVIVSINSNGSIDVGEREEKQLENISTDLLVKIYRTITREDKTWEQLVQENDAKLRENEENEE